MVRMERPDDPEDMPSQRLRTPPASVKRIGMLTPSSNTVLEPVSAAMVAPLPEVSLHFSRFRVTEIALTAAANNQFETGGMLSAAGLLADARVDAICWNGTSGSWLGLDRDRALCALVTRETGIPATTAALAMVETLRSAGLCRVGLVTPYVEAVKDRIVATLVAEGFEVVAECHSGLTENVAFADVTAAEIDRMLRATASAGAEAVVVLCTNLRAAPLAARIEADTGLHILDSVATALRGGLMLAGIDPGRITGWGSVFREGRPAAARDA